MAFSRLSQTSQQTRQFVTKPFQKTTIAIGRVWATCRRACTRRCRSRWPRESCSSGASSRTRKFSVAGARWRGAKASPNFPEFGPCPSFRYRRRSWKSFGRCVLKDGNEQKTGTVANKDLSFCCFLTQSFFANFLCQKYRTVIFAIFWGKCKKI